MGMKKSFRDIGVLFSDETKPESVVRPQIFISYHNNFPSCFLRFIAVIPSGSLFRHSPLHLGKRLNKDRAVIKRISQKV